MVLCDCLFETVVISESLRRVCIPLWSLLESKVAKPARVLVASISLVVGAPCRWWVSTGSLTNHGSWLWKLFGDRWSVLFPEGVDGPLSAESNTESVEEFQGSWMFSSC